MKYIILVSIIGFIQLWSYGQETDTVEYSLLFKNCCSKDIETHGTIYMDWYICDSNGFIQTPKNNIVYLDKNKEYYLNNEGFGILNQVIKLNGSADTDTVTNSCLRAIYPNDLFTYNAIYLNCKDTINDLYVEHFPNGRIRKIGHFKNGRIKDSLNTYYSDGGLKSSIVFTKKDTIYKEFHPNGQTAYLYNSGKKNTYSYFKNGNVKSKRSNINIKRFNRYTH